MQTDRERLALRNTIVDTFSEEVQSRQPPRSLEEERNTRTIKPTVIIGLGGAGCGIGARLKLAVERYYREMPDVLQMVRFVMFDTESHARHRDPIISSTFANNSEYIFLGGFNPREWVADQIQHDENLQRWWPRTTGLEADAPITDGCRRFRPLGRLCLHRSLNTVRTAIGGAIRQAIAMNDKAIQDLSLPPLGEDATLSVHVISGSCGGTGSGMLLDVLTLVRRELAANVQVGGGCSAVIVMPTFYRNLGDAVSERLMRARGANGYAFLRELQHFYHHPDQWANHCADAVSYGAQGSDRTHDVAVPAQTCYLMDDEIAGRTVPDLGSIYGLAADALLQKLISPVAAGTVDNNAHIIKPDRDRVRAFSSMGVSYILYPRKTIARCAGAAVLRDLLDERLRRGMSDEQVDQAKADAEKIFRDQSAQLDAAVVATALSATAQPMRNQIPAGAIIFSEARKPGARKPRLATAMKRAQEKAATAAAQAKRAVDAAAISLATHVKTGLLPTLENECVSMVSSQSVEHALTVLRHVLALVGNAEPPSPVGPDRASSMQSNVSQAAEYVTQVQALEGNWIPDVLEGKRFEPIIRRFAENLAAQFGAEMAEQAAVSARAHRANVVVPALNALVERLLRLSEQLTVIRNQMDALANEQNVQVDEHNLPITTQYVPGGGVRGAADSLARGLKDENPDLVADLFRALAQDGLLWNLSHPHAAARTDATVKAAAVGVRWICRQTVLDTAVRRNLAQVIEAEVGAEHFVKEVLPQAIGLADPTWRVNPSKTGTDLTPETNTLPNWPAGFPDSLLDEATLGKMGDKQGSQEPHKMLILKTEHGLPLHCLGGIGALKNDYIIHLTRDRDRKEPAHISEDWTKDPDMLEDVLPVGRAALDESFALGLFTDWLVRTKKQSAATAIIRNWNNGVVYERTPNQYYVAALKKRGANLTVSAERQLAGGRANASEALTQADAAQVAMFMAKLTSAIGADQVRALVIEYCDAVLEPSTGTRATHAEHLKEQFRKELTALRAYAGEE